MSTTGKTKRAAWFEIWLDSTPKERANSAGMARKFDCTWHTAKKHIHGDGENLIGFVNMAEPKAEIVVQAFDLGADLVDAQAMMAGLATEAESLHNTCKYLAETLSTAIGIARDNSRIHDLQARNAKLESDLSLANQLIDNALAEAMRERELRNKTVYGEA